MKRFIFPWVLSGLITLTTPLVAETTTHSVDPLCSDAELWSGKLITDICWSCLFPLSQRSVSKKSRTVDIPDFTRGAWTSNQPVSLSLEGGANTGVRNVKPDLKM